MIYVLLNNDIPFYVGSTSRNLNSRLSEHKYRSKLQSNDLQRFIFANKNSITISEIGEGTFDDEAFYTNYLRFLGFNLLNTYQGKEQNNLSQEMISIRKSSGHKSKIGDRNRGIQKSADVKNKIRETKYKKNLAYFNQIKNLLSEEKTISQIANILGKDTGNLCATIKRHNLR